MPVLASTFHHDPAAEAERVVRGALDWWRTAGVVGAVGDRPMAWLDRAAPERPKPPERPRPEDARESGSAPSAMPPPAGIDDCFAAMPEELNAFRAWAATAPLPGLPNAGRRAVAGWAEQAEAAVVVAMPARAGTLLDPAEERLLTAMMRAIGRTPADTALLPVAPAAVGPRLTGADARALLPYLTHHLALTGCRRVLLLGEGPCRALLDESAPAARGRWHSVNPDRSQLHAVATLDLATLLAQPACKREAWADLLLFAEGPPA